MTQPVRLPEECIASDDPTWIIDTTLLLPKAATANTPHAKRGRPLRRWTLGGLILVASLGTTRLDATAWAEEVLEGAAAGMTRIEGLASISRATSVFAALPDVPRKVRVPREVQPDEEVQRVDAVTFDAAPLTSDAVLEETEATVLDASAAQGRQGAHDEPEQTSDEPDEAAQEASLDSQESPNARIRRTLVLGRHLLAQHRLTAAAAAFERVLAVRRGHPGALCGLARVALSRGDLDVARKFAERCVGRGPHHAAHHIVLGDALRTLGEVRAADAAYRRASLLRPSRPVDTAARTLPANPF
jgi:hypothetical protein